MTQAQAGCRALLQAALRVGRRSRRALTQLVPSHAQRDGPSTHALSALWEADVPHPAPQQLAHVHLLRVTWTAHSTLILHQVLCVLTLRELTSARIATATTHTYCMEGVRAKHHSPEVPAGAPKRPALDPWPARVRGSRKNAEQPLQRRQCRRTPVQLGPIRLERYTGDPLQRLMSVPCLSRKLGAGVGLSTPVQEQLIAPDGPGPGRRSSER